MADGGREFRPTHGPRTFDEVAAVWRGDVAARAYAARSAGEAGAVALGLVPSETSDKPSVYSTIRHGRKGFSIVSNIGLEAQRKKRLLRLKKTVVTGARLTVAEAKRGGFRGSWAMVTLTYRDDVKWVPKQMTALTKHMREYARRCGFVFRYVWVLELTQRGRPHYHLLVWLPAGRSMPKPDKQGWWPHGKTRIEWAKKPVGYIAKYASKGMDYEQSQLIPKGARLVGHGGLSVEGKTELRWWMLPTWVRDVFSEVADVRRIVGGFVNKETAEFLESPWKVVFLGGSLFLLKKDEVTA